VSVKFKNLNYENVGLPATQELIKIGKTVIKEKVKKLYGDLIHEN